MSFRHPWRVAAVCGVVAALLAESPLSGGQIGPDPRLPAEAPASCRLHTDLFEGANWLERLINPILDTPAEILAAIEARRRVLPCLQSLASQEGAPGWAPHALGQVNLFLTFLAPPAGHGALDDPALDLVDLAVTPDPGVTRLRRDVGLTPPEGFVFIRYFRNREALPEAIQNAFESPDVQAVMLPPRYVAVLAPPGQNPQDFEPRGEALQSLVSHELVHAFLDARLGLEAFEDGFPRWFHEGMAIYFGGGGRVHVVMDFSTGSRMRFEPTPQYEQYERTFLYLESALGQAGFYQVLRQAVENVDVSVLPAAAGVDSYADLVENAEAWWRWWPIPVEPGDRVWLFVAAVAVAMGLLWGGIRRWRPVISQSALEREVNRDLLAAVHMADLRTVRELLGSGADPNAVDGDGWPVLARAVLSGHAGIAEALLDAGAVPTLRITELANALDASDDMLRLLADARVRRGWTS